MTNATPHTGCPECPAISRAIVRREQELEDLRQQAAEHMQTHHGRLTSRTGSRRAPQPPRIAEADKPTDAEVESQRQAARSRFTRIMRSR
jgi:hypothetical protein